MIPEAIFSAGIGELFVIRVAGNVLDNHQLGSIEYAASHLDANVIVMLGHTRCGAVSATIKGSTEGYIRYITDDIREAIGAEKNDYKATVLNVKHGVNVIRQAFREHPEIQSDGLDIVGAVYNVDTGKVDWLNEVPSHEADEQFEETPVQRVTRMEGILDTATAMLNDLELKLEAYEKYQSEIKILEEYYASQQWKEDFELDEKGGFPPDLKRGVLSEDGIYDLLERNREMMERIREKKEPNAIDSME